MDTYPSGATPPPGPAALAYAPPARSPRRAFWVIVIGLITTALVLFAHWAIETYWEWSPMGFYVNRILPAGALIVGLVAGTGYAVGARVSGVKVRRGLLVAVLLLLLACYAGSHYAQYLGLDPAIRAQVSFFEYFDFFTRNMAFTDTKTDKTGGPLEGWGYLVRVAELVAFMGGGVIPLAIVGGGSYCELCQRYMKKKHLINFAASVKAQKIKKADAEAQAAHDREQQEAADVAQAMLEKLQALAAAGEAGEFRQKVEVLKGGEKEAGKLPKHVEVQVVYCDHCFSGTLEPTVVAGSGENITRVPLAVQDLTPDFVREITRG